MQNTKNRFSAFFTKLNFKSLLKYLPICAILIAVDQITKLLVNARMEVHESIPIWPGVFEICYLQNPFASFNFGQSFPEIFLILVLTFTIIFILALIFLMARIPFEKKYSCLIVVLILFFSGTVGNFIDRVAYHYVIDFFYFKLINFPIFNIADIFVVSGAILFIWTFLFRSKLYEELFPEKKKER